MRTIKVPHSTPLDCFAVSSFMSLNTQKRSTAWTFSTSMTSEHIPSFSSSGSRTPDRRDVDCVLASRSPYYVSETACAMEAFAAVNQALGTRNVRQTRPVSKLEPCRPLNVSKKAQQQERPLSCAVTATTSERGINPRYSAASAIVYPDVLAGNQPMQPIRHSMHSRGPADTQRLAPARPALRLITPSSPLWQENLGHRRAERSFRDMGFQSKKLKDRSSCLIM
ncbi:hypothetical protein CTheo_5449 [Ceratobasidium theobromae]|uniref:Uncharacterized protein n=1 Tax=Ceratobasidium theobromae TaxID=1582974 RepID=A0A5N5QHI0_9AGAM|nr:hypothetical protein CTheo_5449 [Ceratobasidium theobromae]